MESPVRNRLEEFLENERLSKSEFCRIIGVSVSFVTSIRASIQPERLMLIMNKFPQLNIVWLLTGVGKMQNSKENDTNLLALVETKDKRIADLEDKIELQRELLDTLREKIAFLESTDVADIKKNIVTKKGIKVVSR